MYSRQLLERFHAPRWVGDLAAPSAVGTEGDPTCGDVIEIAIEVTDEVIRAARFRTFGCVVAIAASDAICEVITGLSLTGARMLGADEIHAVLGGVPEDRISCVVAPLAALRSALARLGLGL
ncbi:MAG: iron-sulfur cluster assembly scaffold protein [Actinomycetota bacterium]